MIRIVDWYVARDFLKLFGFALAILVGISIIVNVFEKLHRYVAWGALASDVAIYYMYTLPKWTLRVAPVALLIAAFLCVGRLSRNYEFLALQMARLHPLRVVLPIIILALGITLCLSVIQEEIAPEASETALRIRHKRIRKDSAFHRTRSQDIWYLAGSDRILHISSLEARKGQMQEISLFQFSSDFALVQRIDATKARWEEGRWILSEARVHHFWGGGVEASIEEVPEIAILLKATPDDLARVEKNAEEMSYRELKRYIRRLSRSGVDTRRYLADLLAKPAMLTANFIMALLGIVFAFRVGRQGLFVHVGTCIAAAFLYWLFFSFALPLARNEVLPPFLVVWFPNVVFGGVSFFGLLRSRPRI
ncbi:MAG: LPS export ABC transporter permease LptG [Candidatus Methylomirabilales bacterium]